MGEELESYSNTYELKFTDKIKRFENYPFSKKYLNHIHKIWG